LAQIKKNREAKERARQARIEEEREADKRAERARAKAKEREARARREQERRQRQRSQDLFSSVTTHSAPPKRTPVKEPSRVRHSSVADRIRENHQNGRTSNRNRESGVKNSYIARVKRHLNNWSAQSIYKGSSATIKLTIRNNGKFRYVITRTTSGSLSAGLRDFLAQLNRMGLGRHDKSSAYVITVHFKAN
jgi:membrane protein involved in colicin uptake